MLRPPSSASCRANDLLAFSRKHLPPSLITRVIFSLRRGWHSRLIIRSLGTSSVVAPGNLRAVQLLLGHTKIESTVRYLGIEIDDAIEIAEKIDV